MRTRIVSTLALTALWCATGAAAPDDLRLDQIHLPPGFHISLVARVKGARSLALSPSGVVYVGTRGSEVYALPPAQGDAPRKVVTIASKLDEPNGVAFRDGALYVAEATRILRFDGIDSRLEDPPNPVSVYSDFPKQRDHEWKFIAFGPDGRLYVPVGAPCNVCELNSPVFASITRMKPDGSDFQIFARGVRNTVGFDWDPRTKDLWFTDNGRDWMADHLPPDELNRAVRPGEHFGYPYCHGRSIPDPEFGKKHSCDEFVPPEVELEPHAAALGLRFYTGSMFPGEYRDRVFIAEHGSWNRKEKVGYRITMVTITDGKAGGYEPFATGWMQEGKAWGRPVDVLVMPDGALLVSDDHAGAVYRISYKP